MDHAKIAKQSMEENKATLDHSFNIVMQPQDHSEKIFFHFVDKNPLFSDNSKVAIYEYILASRQRRSDFKSRSSESHETVADYLMSGLYCRNK